MAWVSGESAERGFGLGRSCEGGEARRTSSASYRHIQCSVEFERENGTGRLTPPTEISPPHHRGPVIMAGDNIFSGKSFYPPILLILAFGMNIVCSCQSDKLASYTVVMHTFWTRDRFPKHYPDWRPTAQFSKLIGEWGGGETINEF